MLSEFVRKFIKQKKSFSHKYIYIFSCIYIYGRVNFFFHHRTHPSSIHTRAYILNTCPYQIPHILEEYDKNKTQKLHVFFFMTISLPFIRFMRIIGLFGTMDVRRPSTCFKFIFGCFFTTSYICVQRATSTVSPSHIEV